LSEALSQLAKSIVQKISNNNANKIAEAKTNVLQTVAQTTVNEAVHNVLDVDISGLATQGYVDEHMPDTSSFVTIEYLNEHMPENTDMSLYPTIETVNAHLRLKANTSDVFTKTETFSKEEVQNLISNFVDKDNVYTSEQIDEMVAKKSDIDDIKDNYVRNSRIFSDDGNGPFRYSHVDEDNSMKLIDMSNQNKLMLFKGFNALKNVRTDITFSKQSTLPIDMVIAAENNETNLGSKIIVSNDRGIFYLKNESENKIIDNREIVVKKDIDDLKEEINNSISSKLDNDSIATVDDFGIIKIGQNITGTEGVISLTGENVTAALGYEPPTKQQVDQSIANLVNSAPETLNTLNALAEALGNDPSFSTTIMAMIGEKLGKEETAKNSEKVNGLTVETAVPFNAKFTDTTYEEVTTEVSGLMSAADKAKLDSISEGANNYVLPVANNSRYGGVKIGNNVSVINGAISITNDNVIQALGYTPVREDAIDALVGNAPEELNTLEKIANTVQSVSFDDIWDEINNKLDKDGTAVNAAKINNLTVETAVPANAVFTDTTYGLATETESGLMSFDDKIKLNGIPNDAKFTDTTYTVATQLADGLMSAADKAKLDSVPEGGYSGGGGDDSYVLPNATSTVLGGVKIGDNITSESGRISVTKTNITTALGYEPPTTQNVETLVSNLVNSAPEMLDTLKELADAIGNDPSFATTITGLIANKLGKTETAKDSEKVNGLTVETAVPAGAKFTDTTYEVATSSTDGLMSAEDKAKLDGLGGSGDYVLPEATDTTLGGVKVGSNITNTNGVISVNKANVTTALGYEPPTLSRVEELVAGLVDSAPETLNTLKEVADALGNDPNFATTITGLLANKLGKTETAVNAEKVNGLTVETAVPADAVFTDTTYEEATTTTAGLMSATDKAKLDGIGEGAGEYTLPAADTSTLGGVKIGSNITNVEGTISINKNNVTTALGYEPPTTQNVQELIDALVDSAPDTLNTLNELATALGNNPNFATTVTELIGSKLGKTETAKDSEKVNGLTVETAVPANAKFTDTTYEEATASNAGLMSAADKAKLDTIDENAASYTLPEATASTLGGVKIGNNVTVSDGTISVTGTNVTDALGFTPLDATATASNAAKVNNLTVQTAVPENALFTDMNVKSEVANTTAAYLTGTTSNVTNTGTQVFDTNVYLTSTAGRLHVESLELGSGIVLL